MHITLRVSRALGNVRKRDPFRAIHLITEGDDRSALSRGLKGLQVRIARALNKLAKRSGQVFTDRYHEHILETPCEVRNALSYVLLNDRRHAAKEGRLQTDHFDPFASGLAFTGWTRSIRSLVEDAPPIAHAKSWLLNVGWLRWGKISPTEIPAVRFHLKKAPRLRKHPSLIGA